MYQDCITPRTGIAVLGRGHISHMVKILTSYKTKQRSHLVYNDHDQGSVKHSFWDPKQITPNCLRFSQKPIYWITKGIGIYMSWNNLIHIIRETKTTDLNLPHTLARIYFNKIDYVYTGMYSPELAYI